MVKFRLHYDADKEMEWLNHMAEQGWAMTGFTLGFYRFEKCEPGEYIYQVDIAEKMFSVSEDYRHFMEEMGVEIVDVWGLWVILRRKAEEGSFELYTDVESSYEYYMKVRNIFLAASILEGGCLLSEVFNGMFFKSAVGWVLALLVVVILAVFLREVISLNGILTELKNRLEPGQGDVSPAAAPRMRTVWMRAGGIAVCLCCVPLLHSFLHELGHCIAVWLCGGSVTGFYPFGPDAHMTYEGVEGNISLALVCVGGTILPLLAAAAVLLLYRGSKRHFLLNASMAILSGSFLFSAMAWIAEPLCYLFGLTDPDEDVIQFLDATGFHPAVVIVCAVLVLALMVYLFVRRIPRILVGFDMFTGISRKFIILVTFATVVLGVALIAVALLTPYKFLAEGDFQYTAEDCGDSLLGEEFSIDIPQKGNYKLYLEWETDEGVIAAAVLEDEEGKVFCYTTGSEYLSVEFDSQYLEKGAYALSFYLLSCEEDWLEYAGLVGANAGDIKDFPWQPNESAAVTGSYKLLQKR